jgi:hypothetical protein
MVINCSHQLQSLVIRHWSLTAVINCRYLSMVIGQLSVVIRKTGTRIGVVQVYTSGSDLFAVPDDK